VHRFIVLTPTRRIIARAFDEERGSLDILWSSFTNCFVMVRSRCEIGMLVEKVATVLKIAKGHFEKSK
jgi:hypothetical protein